MKDVGNLLVAALVWGTGTKARSVHRRAQIFRHSPDTDIDARLDVALEALQERGATEAYWALNEEGGQVAFPKDTQRAWRLADAGRVLRETGECELWMMP
ncbi:hypothetical protein ACFYNZ_33275 [Streptomyces kebangsaanensis]|uniref:Uncharacterized protein n=1 Tax=Streptomyces kebangsaanensis TaxID=864058 RepID=A0ABW6L4Z3_9ACTN